MRFKLTPMSMQRPRSTRCPLFGSAMVLVLGLAVAVVLALPGSAAVASQPAPQSYYLALGDSIAYGAQPDKGSAGLPPSAFNTGYVDVFAARLRALAPKIRVVNYGCPGESTTTFIAGGCSGRHDVKGLHDDFKGAQLKAAVAFLRAHRDQVSPITLTLWGNDLFEILDACKGKPACVRARAPRTIASGLTKILRQLRAAAPKAEIIVTGTWNPFVDDLEQTDPLLRSLNATIARVAKTAHAGFADTFPVFNPQGNLAHEKARICALTFACSTKYKGDPHPTDAGYRALAAAVWAASGYPRKP